MRLSQKRSVLLAPALCCSDFGHGPLSRLPSSNISACEVWTFKFGLLHDFPSSGVLSAANVLGATRSATGLCEREAQVHPGTAAYQLSC